MMMNEYEIDEAVALAKEYFPHLEKYAVFLRDWKDTVNENSDGWAHWKAGRQCAESLVRLLGGMKMARHREGEIAPQLEFQKALVPILSAATKLKLPAPVLKANSKDLANVVFYYGVGENDNILDHLVQTDPPPHWVPAIANFNGNRNLDNLMSMANISPRDWQNYLIERFKFDPVNPTAEGLLNAGVPADRIEFALESARERAEEWADPDTFLWQSDDTAINNLHEDQVYEVLAESRGRGIPVIAFRAPEDSVKDALSGDNVIMVSSDSGIYVGLCDPVNGYGWSPQQVCDPVCFRPSLEGRVHMVGDNHPIFEHVGPEAYKTWIQSTRAEPVMVSTRSKKRVQLPAPPVVDERYESYVPGMK